MARGKRLIVSLTLAALALAALTMGGASAGAPTATASRACSVSSHGGAYGKDMYVLDLSVRHTTCRKGKRVIRAYTDCRHQHGGLNGRCPNRVLHYRCHEGERTVAPHIQYTVEVGCRRGDRRIRFTYTQQI
jgi:ribonuclease I